MFKKGGRHKLQAHYKKTQNYQNKKLQRSYIEADSIRGLHSLDVCVCEIGAAIMRQRWMFQKEEKELCFYFIGLIRSFDKMCSSFYHDRKGHCPWDRWAVMEKEIDISLRESSVTRGEGGPEGHYLGEHRRTRLFTKSRPSTSPEQEIPELSVTNYLYLESK